MKSTKNRRQKEKNKKIGKNAEEEEITYALLVRLDLSSFTHVD